MSTEYSPSSIVKWVIFLVFLVVITVTGYELVKMRYMPLYKVWEQRLAGEAELGRAEQNRKIAIQEAEAKRDAAKFLAEAEVERAKGVAEANKIIGEGLKGHSEYLRYLWIMSMEHVANSVNGSTVVYVPTEATIPILESRRLPAGRGDSFPGNGSPRGAIGDAP